MRWRTTPYASAARLAVSACALIDARMLPFTLSGVERFVRPLVDHDLPALDHHHGVQHVPVAIERVGPERDDVGGLTRFEGADIAAHLDEGGAVWTHQLHDVRHR